MLYKVQLVHLSTQPLHFVVTPLTILKDTPKTFRVLPETVDKTSKFEVEKNTSTIRKETIGTISTIFMESQLRTVRYDAIAQDASEIEALKQKMLERVTTHFQKQKEYLSYFEDCLHRLTTEHADSEGGSDEQRTPSLDD